MNIFPLQIGSKVDDNDLNKKLLSFHFTHMQGQYFTRNTNHINKDPQELKHKITSQSQMYQFSSITYVQF